jgi:HEAT repeat protein
VLSVFAFMLPCWLHGMAYVSCARGDQGDRIAGFRRDLASDDVLQRRRGTRGLAALGDFAAAAQDELIAALGDQDEHVRAAAIEGTTRVGSPAIGRLLRIVQQGQAPAKKSAMRVLLNLASLLPPEAAEVLEPLLADEDAEVRRWAGSALRVMGDKAQSVAAKIVDRALHSQNADQQEAMSIISELGPAVKQLLPTIAAALQKGGELSLRGGDVLERLPAFTPEDRDQVRVLVELLKDQDHRVQSHAMWFLTQIGRDARAAIPTLRQLTENEEAPAQSRYEAIRCAGRILRDEKEGIDFASEWARASNVPLVAAALMALAENTADPDRAKELLKEIAESTDSPGEIRAVASAALKLQASRARN